MLYLYKIGNELLQHHRCIEKEEMKKLIHKITDEYDLIEWDWNRIVEILTCQHGFSLAFIQFDAVKEL